MHLEQLGYSTVFAGPSLDVMPGSSGSNVRPDVIFPIVNIDDYDALVFVGAPDLREYYVADPDVNRVIQAALEKGKVVAAICRALEILIEADILDGRQATIIEPEKECHQLEEVGAICTGELTQRDGWIITSQGPHSALSFARTISEALIGP
jgi:putative intracellular protease/amidase